MASGAYSSTALRSVRYSVFMNANDKQYLGDGVYITFDGWGWWLEAEQPHGLQRIYIDGPATGKKLAKMMGLSK